MKIAQESLKLEKLEWKEFVIGEIFDIYTGAIINQDFIKTGLIPRITATDLNNGIACFTSDLKHKNFRALENFISISFLGSVFYQRGRVSLDMKIHAIKPKNRELNAHIALFLIPLIKNFTFKYMYGYQLSTRILKNQKILLPTDPKGNPNWEFMENYMRNLEHKHLEKITAYYEAKLAECKGGGVSFELEEYKNFTKEPIKWKEFIIGELFESIEKGKCKNFNQETNESKKGISFLSATLNNNGVSAFVAKNSLMQKGNCIMFVNQGDGGAGYAVYKYENFISTSSCSFGYAKWINKYTGCFVASILCRFKEKYSFGYGRTESRLKNDKILLPTDLEGNPNWEFMENYMRNLEQKILQKALVYYSNKLLEYEGANE